MTPRLSLVLMSVALAAAATLSPAAPSRACNCVPFTQREAFETSDVVAQVIVLRIQRAEEDWMMRQPHLLRFDRVYKGPSALQDGDVRWVDFLECNSLASTLRHVGARYIAHLTWAPRLSMGLCTPAYEIDQVTTYMLRARAARARSGEP